MSTYKWWQKILFSLLYSCGVYHSLEEREGERGRVVGEKREGRKMERWYFAYLLESVACLGPKFSLLREV